MQRSYVRHAYVDDVRQQRCVYVVCAHVPMNRCDSHRNALAYWFYIRDHIDGDFLHFVCSLPIWCRRENHCAIRNTFYDLSVVPERLKIEKMGKIRLF